VRAHRQKLLAFSCVIVIATLEATQCASPVPPPLLPPPPPVRVEPVQPCPTEMVEVPGASGSFCIDRYEASIVRRTGGSSNDWPGNQPVDGKEAEMVAVSRAGRKPQGYISGMQAAEACKHAEKRLCARDEWLSACRGPQHTRYPYGDVRREGICNDRFDRPTAHPVTRLFQATKARGDSADKMWQPSFMNDPRLHELSDTVSASGAFPGCTNEYGALDMVGNLHEWIADPKGSFLGGYFMDTIRNGEGCEYRTTAHDFSYHDYSTGFRCCADIAPRNLR
jgi:sulfatase modifying factor 1